MQQEIAMKKFLIAAIAALALSVSLGSAFAATSPNAGTTVNQNAPSFVYNETGG